MKRYILALLALLAFFAFQATSTATAQDGPYVVIVHPDNPLSNLTKSQTSLFLLKKRSRWPDSNLQIEPVDLGSDSEVRAAMSRDVHKKSVSTIKNYWQKQIFSGRNTPPPELTTDTEVVTWVSSRPGAIGYVSAGTRLDGVKAVSLVN